MPCLSFFPRLGQNDVYVSRDAAGSDWEHYVDPSAAAMAHGENKKKEQGGRHVRQGEAQLAQHPVKRVTAAENRR